MEGATAYEIQVSRTKDFSKPLSTQRLKTPDFSTSLAPGKYFYRVRVVDTSNHPGKWTSPAPLKVANPPPDLISPADGFEAAYFDRPAEVIFKWKPSDLTAVYEIVIHDSSGTEVFHTTQDKTEYKANLPKGEYQWQVRTLGRSPIPGQTATDDVPSDFTKARVVKVKRNDLEKPTLISPVSGAHLTSQNSVDFSWKQDAHTHFADVDVEKLDGGKGDFKKIENVEGTSVSRKIEIPGDYRWSVTAKEEKTSPGITSDTRDFSILKDPLFAGNYELEVSTAYVTDVYQTNSSLQIQTPTQTQQQSTASGMRYGFSLGYYVFRSLGFFVSAQEGGLSLENTNSGPNEIDGTLRLRYGANGFFQEFWFGYREMDIMEAENTPRSQTIDFSTTGPLVGTRLSADVNSRIKIQATAYYYRPLSENQTMNYGPFNADVAGGSLGIKYNVRGQFWVGYRYAIERVNAQVVGLLSPPYINSSWGQIRNEPIYLSVSFER
jgi:hypothetical protein